MSPSSSVAPHELTEFLDAAPQEMMGCRKLCCVVNEEASSVVAPANQDRAQKSQGQIPVQYPWRQASTKSGLRNKIVCKPSWNGTRMHHRWRPTHRNRRAHSPIRLTVAGCFRLAAIASVQESRETHFYTAKPPVEGPLDRRRVSNFALHTISHGRQVSSMTRTWCSGMSRSITCEPRSYFPIC